MKKKTRNILMGLTTSLVIASVVVGSSIGVIEKSSFNQNNTSSKNNLNNSSEVSSKWNGVSSSERQTLNNVLLSEEANPDNNLKFKVNEFAINEMKAIQQQNNYDSDEFTTTYDGVGYSIEILPNQSVVVTALGFVTQPKSSILTIPSTIECSSISTIFPVTNIAPYAFYDSNLTEVNLPNTIQTIGDSAFANNFISSIQIPSNLVNLGNNAFSNEMFPYGYTINLPSNCIWSKSADLAPFNSNNNYGVFTSTVQFIIQSDSVYTYQPNDNGWVITSYLPYSGNQSSNVHLNNNAFRNISVTLSKPKNTTPFSKPITTQPVMQTKSLANTAFLFCQPNWSGLAGEVMGVIYFDLSDMQIKVSGGYWSGYSTRMGSTSTDWNFSVYSPMTDSYVMNKTFNSGWDTDTFTSNFGSGVNFNYGDIITLQLPSSLISGIGTNSNYPAYVGVFNGLTTSFLEQAYWNCNLTFGAQWYYLFKKSWSQKTNGIDQFMITPQGLVPYVNTTHVNPITVLTSSTSNNESFTITGTAEPNTWVQAQIGNYTSDKVNVSSSGTFSIPIILSSSEASSLSTTESVVISSENAPDVYTHLEGANPNQSAFMMGFNQAFSFMILPDGKTGKLEAWHNTYLPSFENSDNVYENTGYLSSNDSKFGFWNDGTFYIGITTPNGTITMNPISISTSMTDAELAQQIDNVDYQNGDTVAFYLPSSWGDRDLWVKAALSNNSYFQFNHILVDYNNISYVLFKFTTSSNGIANDIQYGSSCKFEDVSYSNTWNATNYMIEGGWYGSLETDSRAVQFNDPTTAMVTLVKEITNGLSSDYDKALAIEEWIHDNMTWTQSYSYGHTISQTFNHLEGVCGDFADLFMVMAQIAGLVSRVVIGYANSGVNYFTKYSAIDHSWVQVWIESLGEWLTLDPTFGWNTTLGGIQSDFNIMRSSEIIAAVMWPAGTNYFSYFKNYEYEALSLLGQYYGVGYNQSAGQYPASYAQGFTALLDVANSGKLTGSTPYATINWI